MLPGADYRRRVLARHLHWVDDVPREIRGRNKVTKVTNVASPITWRESVANPGVKMA